MKIGAFYKQQRRALKMSQRELSEKAGVAPLTVINVEHDRTSPHWHVLVRMAKVLGISLTATAVEDLASTDIMD